jgi:hypothetical protein
MVWSRKSVVVDSQPERITKPVVPGPLLECATMVYVTNLLSGATVCVKSSLHGIIGGADVHIYATHIYAEVSVTPLEANDKITAFQFGCGLESEMSSPPQPVHGLDIPPPPPK